MDTATIAEIRDIQKQAAQELGQWIKRTETLDLNQLFERMSDAEMEAVINQVHSFLERVLQSELDLAVVCSSVGDGGAPWHIDSNLRTTPR